MAPFGDPVELAERYNLQSADELVFLDITASHEQRETIVQLARRTADEATGLEEFLALFDGRIAAFARAQTVRGRDEIGAMWTMLCEVTQAKGRDVWKLDYSVTDQRSHWEAHYRFSATGRMVHNIIDGEFVVFKGSQTRLEWSSTEGTYAGLFRELTRNGVLELADDGLHRVFTRDYAFSSPSAAAAVIAGRSANGRTHWVDEATGQTYAAWQEDRINKAMGRRVSLHQPARWRHRSGSHAHRHRPGPGRAARPGLGRRRPRSAR